MLNIDIEIGSGIRRTVKKLHHRRSRDDCARHELYHSKRLDILFGEVRREHTLDIEIELAIIGHSNASRFIYLAKVDQIHWRQFIEDTSPDVEMW